MPRKGKSFYIENNGPHELPITRGVSWLLKVAAQHNKNAAIAVYQLQNLRNVSSWISEPYKSIFLQLEKKRQITSSGFNIRLITMKEKWGPHVNGPILVLYGGQKLCNLLDGLEILADMLVVPWTMTEAESWIQTWRAKSLDVSLSNSIPTKSENPVIRVAIDDLSRSVNLGTGIGHPSDKQAAIAVLETLFYKNIDTHPEELRQALIRSGWLPDHAEDVKSLAAQIWSGGRPRGSTGQANEQRWIFWQDRLNSSDYA